MVVAVSWGIISNFPGPNFSFTAWFYLACSLSLAALLSIFAAVKRGWKIYITAFFFLCLDGFNLALMGSQVDAIIILLPLLIATPILITLESVGLFWGTFTNSELVSRPFSGGFQFRISHLFIITSVIAVMILIVKGLLPSFSGELRTYVSSAIIVAVLSVNTLINVWAILGETTRMRLLAFLIAASMILAVSWLVSLRRYLGNGEVVFWICFTGLSWAPSTLLLYLLRQEGYRFVWYRR